MPDCLQCPYYTFIQIQKNTNAVCLCLNITGVYYHNLCIVYFSCQLFLTVLQLEQKQRICTKCLYVIQHQLKILEYIRNHKYGIPLLSLTP